MEGVSEPKDCHLERIITKMEWWYFLDLHKIEFWYTNPTHKVREINVKNT